MVRRPLLLDLFCCEGGAAVGYHRAGFDVVGVDIEPQPRYPFPMVVADALEPPFDLTRFDAIHASPPCQAYTPLRVLSDNEHPDLVDVTRDMLRASGRPWVMENVPGAPMDPTIILCGSSFGMKVRRHRWFESNIGLFGLPCNHAIQGQAIGVYGHAGGRDKGRGRKATSAESREVMDMPWASHYGAAQAIPPAYTEFIGRQLINQLEVAA
jgi:DNA (cytosine-5)-methyltransferase 1